MNDDCDCPGAESLMGPSRHKGTGKQRRKDTQRKEEYVSGSDKHPAPGPNYAGNQLPARKGKKPTRKPPKSAEDASDTGVLAHDREVREYEADQRKVGPSRMNKFAKHWEQTSKR